MWRFMPEDGELFLVKKIAEDSKHESNALLRLDDKRLLSADLYEKKLIIFKWIYFID